MTALRAAAMAIVVGLSLGVAPSADGQPPPAAAGAAGSPEAFAARYVEALRNQRWGDAAALMHPEALAELRALFAPIMEHPEGAEVGRQMFGVADSAEFARTSDVALFESFLRTVAEGSPEFATAMTGATTQFLGHVDEGPNLTHVVFRLTMAVEKLSISKLDVMSLRRLGGEWRAVLTGDVRGIAEAVRRQVGA